LIPNELNNEFNYINEYLTISKKWNKCKDINDNIKNTYKIYKTLLSNKLNGEYPITLVNLLQKYNINLLDLPILDLKGRTGYTDYIDFLTPMDLSSPIMRFKDSYKRYGISLKLKSKNLIEDEYIEIIFTIFRRYTDRINDMRTIWSYNKSIISSEYYKYNKSIHNCGNEHYCFDCESKLSNIVFMDLETLGCLLNNTDPICSICN
jgi:hypothetical protein